MWHRGRMRSLTILVVDDEEHARNDLEWLLSRSPAVGNVVAASTGADALRLLDGRDDIDGVFLDVQMPGLNGVELMRILRNFKTPPTVAFVTAFDGYALDAFDLDVCDYLLKPVEQERLDETLRRMRERRTSEGDDAAFSVLSGRVGSRTFEVSRDEVELIEAAGDYVRVHSREGSYLVRESISSLTSAWSSAGFIRIHRSYLVRARAISSMQTIDGSCTVCVAGQELPVSRRYRRLLEDRLGND